MAKITKIGVKGLNLIKEFDEKFDRFIASYENNDDFNLLMWAWVVATAWIAFGMYVYWGS
jgi:hypothetical protein